MKIKKFEGKTENDIMKRVRDELGYTAIILSIKRKPRRGLFSVFMPPTIVITAAYEEKTPAEKMRDSKITVDKKAFAETAKAAIMQNRVNPPQPPGINPAAVPAERALNNVKLNDQKQLIASLENKLSVTEELLAKVLTQLNIAEQMASRTGPRKYGNNVVQLFFDSLVEQGVSREIAEKILDSVDVIDESDELDTSLIIKIVYNTVLEILGEPQVMGKTNGETEIAAFFGPTGVGKTTTIAKLSSSLTLNNGLRVGLITADTYRIAAVEQLKVYADILGLDIQVVYNNEEITENLNILKDKNDVILIDTAGRSHRSGENMNELKALLDVIPECKKYLVLGVNTKYEDLLKIVNAYSAAADFNVLFTKLDETEALGSILNLCYLTGKHVSYVTFGQNVPDDIEILQPEKITKSLLGLHHAADGTETGEGEGD